MMVLHDQEKDTILVAGHTHKPGHCAEGWYWNSGSWVYGTNDFLEINPAGAVKGFRWLGDRMGEADITIPLPTPAQA